MIRSVIFDLSEVLLPGLVGVENHLAEKTGLPTEKITQALGSRPHYQKGNILDDLLTGRISYEQYRTAFLRSTGLPGSSSAIFDEQCLRMFSTPYEYTEELLATVATRCDVFLLSDHCETWACWIKGKHQFMSIFKDVVWSYETGTIKGELKSFELLVSRNHLEPEACLFVDDLERNTVTARRMGMKTVHFTGRDSIAEIYSSIGIGPPRAAANGAPRRR